MTDWMVADDAVVGTSPIALPPICVDCGRESPDNLYIETKLYWYPRWIWVGLIWGVFPAVLLYYAARRPLLIGYALCDDHVRWLRARRRLAYTMWAIFVALVVASVATRAWEPLLIATFVVFVISAIASMMSWSPLRVAAHDDGVFGVRGFSAEFLRRAAPRSPRA
jgi:hypothetical protein